MLLGADDDDADPRSCIDKAKQNAAKGLPVEFAVFPGTTHAFDNSLMGDKPIVIQQGREKTVTHRYNKQAVEAAWRLILAFLERHLGAPR